MVYKIHIFLNFSMLTVTVIYDTAAFVFLFLFKDLPEGAAFSAVYQETKDNLPACKLRVSLRSAADQIWEDYANGKLMSILKENLLSGMDASDKSSRLRMRIHIMKEEYEWACTILAGKIDLSFFWY